MPSAATSRSLASSSARSTAKSSGPRLPPPTHTEVNPGPLDRPRRVPRRATRSPCSAPSRFPPARAPSAARPRVSSVAMCVVISRPAAFRPPQRPVVRVIGRPGGQAGLLASVVPSGWRVSCQPRRWTQTSWWNWHKSTQLPTEVSPPSALWRRWVGSGRSALPGLLPGGFLRPARRTRRAALTAPGSPRALLAGLCFRLGRPRGWYAGPAVAVAGHVARADRACEPCSAVTARYPGSRRRRSACGSLAWSARRVLGAFAAASA